MSYITPTVWHAHFIAYSEAELYEHLILVIAIEKLKKVYKDVISDPESERTVSQWILLYGYIIEWLLQMYEKWSILSSEVW